MQTVTATWQAVPGFDGILEASTDGQIRTIGQERIDVRGRQFRRPGKVLSQSYNHDRMVVYFRDLTSKVKAVPVANAVAAAFIRPMQPGEVIAWRDGNRRNNSVDNLQIVARNKQAATAR